MKNDRLKIKNNQPQVEKNNIIVIDSLTGDKNYYLKTGENKTFIIFLTGGDSQKGKIKIILQGKTAKAQILGMVIGTKNQNIELSTLQDHLQPETVSDMFIKSVLFDQAKFSYHGLIRIEKNAQKSNAYQKNQNLLLSEDAWADSRPYLEILANDVRCTHGVATGKLDEESLFYLQSRGLNKSEATKLLIRGYFNPLLERIPDKKWQDNLEEKITKKISQLLRS